MANRDSFGHSSSENSAFAVQPDGQDYHNAIPDDPSTIPSSNTTDHSSRAYESVIQSDVSMLRLSYVVGC